jgi:hypothetical protein
MLSYNPIYFNFNPDSLIRFIIEIVPFHVCSVPVVIEKSTGREVPNSIIVPLIKAIKNNWCNARLKSRSILLAREDGSVMVTIPFEEIEKTGKISYYQNRVIEVRDPADNKIKTGFLMYGVDRYSSDCHEVYNQSPILTETVMEAICLYRTVLRRLKERVEDSNNTMVSLDAESGGASLAETYQELESQFALKKRIYAPKGSSIQGVNFALADVDTSIEPFLKNISFETGIPLWMFERNINNSQFILEDKEAYLQKLFLMNVLEPLNYIFTTWGVAVEIQTPSFRAESFNIEMASKLAEIDYKRAATERLDAITKQLENPPKDGKIPSGGSVGGRTL